MMENKSIAISLKRVKIEEKLLRTAYRNSPTLFRTVPLGVCNLATPLIPGTGKATDFKFCRNIHRVDRNKSP